MSDLVKRLRRNPVICMDGQDITSDAADTIEAQAKRIAELEYRLRVKERVLDWLANAGDE